MIYNKRLYIKFVIINNLNKNFISKSPLFHVRKETGEKMEENKKKKQQLVWYNGIDTKNNKMLFIFKCICYYSLQIKPSFNIPGSL